MNEQHEHNVDPGLETSSDATNASEERGGDVLSLIADVESHLARIRNVQNRQQDEFADLAERQRRVTAAEALVEERSGEIARLQDEIAETRTRMDTERSEFESARRDFEDVQATYRRDAEALLQDQRALEELQTRNQNDASRNSEERSRLEGWSQDLEGRERAAEERISNAEQERDRVAEELQRSAAEFTTRLEAYESGEQAFREQRETLDRKVEELSSRISELENEKSIAEESRESARADLDAAHERCRSLEEDLQARSEATSELEGRLSAQEDVIAEGVEALEIAKSRVAELESVTQEDQRQLQLAGSKLAELAEAIAEQAPRLERGAEAMALVAELESELQRVREESRQGRDEIEAPLLARIADLEAGLELARRRESDVSAADVDVEALVAERTRELQQALDAAVSRAQDAGTVDSVSKEQFEALRVECARLERRGDELETALSMTNDRGQAQEMAKQLRRRAERVSEIARHLDRRKARLGSMRSILKRREEQIASSVGGAGSLHENQRIEAQRQELEEVRDFLARSEQQMVRRWARPRAFATAAWLLVIMVLSAAAGWIGVDRFMPGPGSASVLLTAKTADGSPLTDRAAEDWNTWHRALATDPAFVALVQKRLAMRGIADGSTETKTADLLANQLAFEDEGMGRMRLVLAGTDRRTVEPTLDAIATAMVSESSRQAPRREQGARATLPAERSVHAGGGYASTVNDAPDREMMIRSGVVAGGFFLCSLIVVGLVYSILSRSKRVFESRESGNEIAAAG